MKKIIITIVVLIVITIVGFGALGIVSSINNKNKAQEVIEQLDREELSEPEVGVIDAYEQDVNAELDNSNIEGASGYNDREY